MIATFRLLRPDKTKAKWEEVARNVVILEETPRHEIFHLASQWSANQSEQKGDKLVIECSDGRVWEISS